MSRAIQEDRREKSLRQRELNWAKSSEFKKINKSLWYVYRNEKMPKWVEWSSQEDREADGDQNKKSHVRSFHFVLKVMGAFEKFYAWSTRDTVVFLHDSSSSSMSPLCIEWQLLSRLEAG